MFQRSSNIFRVQEEYVIIMPAQNVLANLFVTLYNNEARRKSECIVLPTSKLGIEVLKTLQKDGYIGEFEHIDDNRGGKFKIRLLAKITKCGAISPRFKVKNEEYNDWEQQYLPAYNRGMLLVTTNQGVMSHHEAVNKGLGGFLIGYVY
jgi:small subunit ribosomal protein S8